VAAESGPLNIEVGDKKKKKADFSFLVRTVSKFQERSLPGANNRCQPLTCDNSTAP
jgi:hypothetical protein